MTKCLGKAFKSSGKIFMAVLVLVLIMSVSVLIGSSQPALAQGHEIGDYQSAGTGPWNNPSTWDVWNGTSWDDATTWPGQNDGDEYTVTIQSGHIITESNVGELFFGDLIVYGELALSHDLSLETTDYLLVDGGSLHWIANNVKLSLQVNIRLKIINVKDGSGQVIEGLGLYGSPASNNQELWIGDVKFAAASGGGNVVYTFDMVNEAGGALMAVPTAVPYEFTYNGDELTTTLWGEARGCCSDPEEADLFFEWEGTGPDSFNWSFTGQNPLDVTLNGAAGSYIFTLTVTSIHIDSGFEFSTSTDVEITVHPLTVYVTANAQGKNYGDADPALTYTYTPALAGGDTFNGALSRDAGEDVGTYAITQGTLTLSSNYILDYTGANLTISPLTIYVTADPQGKTYGGTDPVLTYDYTPALVGGDTFSGTLARNAGEDVGTYAITQGTLTLSSNYNLDYTGNDLTISERTIYVTADPKSKTYGDADPVLTYDYTPVLVGGDTFSGALIREAGEDVGTYAITQGTLDLSSNYILDYTGTNLTISLLTINVTANAQSKTYGDADPVLTYDYAPLLVHGDTFSGALAREAGEDVGTYAITQDTLNISSNYILNYTGANLTIDPLTIYVTADAQSKTYNDADPALTYTYTPELIDGDSFSGALIRETGEDVGTYAINQNTLALSSNYNLDYTGANLTINPLIIYVTADAQSKTYDDAGPPLTYTYTPELIDGDSFSGALTRETGEDVGTYAITQGTLILISNNCIMDYTGANMTIKPKTLIITAGNWSKTYGATVTFTGTEFVATGLVNDDTVTSITLTSDGAEDSAPVAGSPYAIVPSGAVGTGLDNYDITYVNSNLTVSKATVGCNISSSASTLTYGQSVTFTATVTNTGATGIVTFKDGDTILGSTTLINGTATYSTSDLSASDYSVTAVYSGDGNFTGKTSSPVDLTVKNAVNWWLIGGIIAAVCAVLLLLWWLFLNRSKPNIFLAISEPLNETTVYSPDLIVKGQTEPNAMISINDSVVDVAADGNFSTTLALEEGPNMIEVMTSNFEGNEGSKSITVNYIKQ